jgi:hypothetical protein
MPKPNHLARSRWFWIFVLVSSLVFPARELLAQNGSLKPKVHVVEVFTDGKKLTVNPDTVKVKKKAEIVIWVTNGQSMAIDFNKPGNPAPGNPFTDLVCNKGRFCGALKPPEVEGTFKYKVTVDGIVLDPNVEVVK